MPINVVIPSVGGSVRKVTISRWLRSQGDTVTADESIVEIETDKITQELPAPTAGRLAKIVVATGTKVKVGEVIAVLEPDES